MNLNDKVAQYIKLRSSRAEIKKIYTESDKGLKEKMNLIEMNILEFLNETGQTSAKTDHGTAFKQESMSVTVSDAPQFFEFVINNKAVDLLERRVNKTVYKSYIKDGMVIPGVNVYKEAKIMVRKS